MKLQVSSVIADIGSLFKTCNIKVTNEEDIFFCQWNVGNTFSFMLLLLFIAT